jgi:uncharacterized membrane protein (DUF373 family)
MYDAFAIPAISGAVYFATATCHEGLVCLTAVGVSIKVASTAIQAMRKTLTATSKTKTVKCILFFFIYAQPAFSVSTNISAGAAKTET